MSVSCHLYQGVWEKTSPNSSWVPSLFSDLAVPMPKEQIGTTQSNADLSTSLDLHVTGLEKVN